jgi:hypothetical protein
MEGFNSAEERGIIPRAIEQIFKHIQTTLSPRMRFLVRASYLQIYNEVISDLLKPERSNLVIREDKKKVRRASIAAAVCRTGRPYGTVPHALPHNSFICCRSPHRSLSFDDYTHTRTVCVRCRSCCLRCYHWI